MYKIYNDENILVAEGDTLSVSTEELLEGNGYTIKHYTQEFRKEENLSETKIKELEIEKKKLHKIIEHFAFQNNVNNNFIKDLINTNDKELNI